MRPPSSHTQHARVSPALLASASKDDLAITNLTDVAMDRSRSREPTLMPLAEAQATPMTVVHSASIQGSMECGEHDQDGTSRATVDNSLQDLLCDKVKREFPVIEFIEAVWGLPWAEVQSPEEGYSLKEAAVVAYIDNEYHTEDDIKTEQNACGPFQEIVEDIIRQIASVHSVLGTRASFVNTRDRTVDGFFAKFQPDFLWSWQQDSQEAKHSWLLVALCGKLEKNVMTRFEFKVEVGMENLKKYTRTLSLPKTSTKVDGPPTTATHNSPAVATASRADPVLTPASVTLRPSPSESVTKHKRASDSESESVAVHRSKRTRNGEGLTSLLSIAAAPEDDDSDSKSAASADGKLSPNELQIVRYLNEHGSHGVRSYVTGFLIENCDITLWYIDRMGVIKSCTFNFVTESHIFVYFIASISLASYHQLGICSLLDMPHARLVPDTVLTLYKSVPLRLRKAHDINSRPLDSLLFHLEVSEERKMTTSYCFFGRATTIVPVTASKSTDEMLKSTAEDISVATGSIPTATRGRRRPSDIHNATTPIMTTPMKLVAKLSWQLKWKRGEDIMISRIRTTLVKIDSKKRFLDNIIDMKCSASYSMACDDIRLPRAEMYGMTDPLYERVCRVLVLREYLPLHKIRSPDDFKVIFIDVVRAHHAVHESTNILHRDISPNNIMFYYRDDNPLAQAVGVLCDWDLAKQFPPPSHQVIITDLLDSIKPIPDLVEVSFGNLESMQPVMNVHQLDGIVATADAEAVRHEPRYRTGTGPFIALDILLYNHVPTHLYRHDLESFFWVLVWFVACFDPVSGELKDIDSWLQPSLALIGREKVKFLGNTTFTSVTSSTHECYRELCDKWVRSTQALVLKVYEQYEKYMTSAPKKERLARLNGDFDEAKFEEEMRQNVFKLVKKREAILTFDTFIKCLV